MLIDCSQTRPVYVETLILRNTVEEKLFERSKKMSRQEHADATQLYDDQGICSIVQNARLLPVDSGDGQGYGQTAPLLDNMRIQIFGRKDRGDTKIVGIDRATEVENPEQIKPAKRPKKSGGVQILKTKDSTAGIAVSNSPLAALTTVSSSVAAAVSSASGTALSTEISVSNSIFG